MLKLARQQGRAPLEALRELRAPHELAKGLGTQLGARALLLACLQVSKGSLKSRYVGVRGATLAPMPLLIIDDFGLKSPCAPADEDLHDLIAERYEQAPPS